MKGHRGIIMANNRKKKEQNAPNSMMLRRTLLMLIVCGIAAFLVLGGRLFYLQIIMHEEYENAAIEQQVRDTTITPNRGTLYDRNMKILAMSASVDTIYISPAEIKANGEDTQLIASKLSEILGVDYTTILDKTKNTASYYQTVARKVDEETSAKVREFINEYGLVGVKMEVDTKRYYPYGALASHIIGFVGSENSGLLGLESTLDETLTGISGRVVRMKTNTGVDMLYTKYENYYDAEDGSDVVLTIDSTIQYYLEKHLEQAVSDYNVQEGAAAIAMDVNTGEVLGMVSLGNFDLNNYQIVPDEVYEQMEQAENQESKDAILAQAQNLMWRNKAINDTYEPGSTFKIITLAMALEEGVADLNTQLYCPGHIQVAGDDQARNCWKRTGHGSQTLVQAVQHSCNVAMITLGVRVGAEAFYDYIEAFGFFDKTGIELSGEEQGIWWSSEVFEDPQSKSQLAAASFGQTFTITPIQLITAVSACVNGGNLMEPYLVSKVLDEDGGIVSQTEPTAVRQVISKETSDKVNYILELVVSDKVEGTGKNAYVPGYRIGGKTGTSEKISMLAQTGVKEYIVSFLGVAPMDDPQIAILVLLDNPDGTTANVSGGTMAAPTVGSMFADILPYMGIEPVYTEAEKALMDKSVPNLVTMSVAEAQAYLQKTGFTSRVIGTGDTVTAQLPLANYTVAAGSEMILYADAEPSGEKETMIDLEGLTYEQARIRMSWLGLYIKTDSNYLSDSAYIVVSKQSVAEGEMLEHGSVVDITLVNSDMSNFGLY